MWYKGDDTRMRFTNLLQMVAPPKQRLSYPMFVFSDGHSNEVKIDTAEKDRLLRVKHVRVDEYGRIRSQTLDSEEFVVL